MVNVCSGVGSQIGFQVKQVDYKYEASCRGWLENSASGFFLYSLKDPIRCGVMSGMGQDSHLFLNPSHYWSR